MNREETKLAIKVMQAYADGETIQSREGKRSWQIPSGWKTIDGMEPDWDWYNHYYRIKPEPMEIEVWVRPNGERAGIVEPADDSAIRKGTELGWTKRKFREVMDE